MVLIIAGNAIFALGNPWSHIAGYIGCGVGFVGYIYLLIRHKQWKLFRIFSLVLFLFFLWGIIASFISAEHLTQSFEALFRHFAHWVFPFLLGYFLINKLRLTASLVWASTFLLLGLISIAALAGIFESPSFAKEGMIWGRHSHIQFGALLLIAFHIFYGLMLTPSVKKNYAVLAGFGAVLLMIFVIMSGSRGYWGAAGISAAAATIYSIMKNRRRLAAGIIAVIGLFTIIVAVTAIPQVQARINRTNLNDMNIIHRKNMAIMALNIIADHPGTGIGPGQIPYAKKYYDKMESLNLPVETGYLKKTHVHNFYLNTTVETGLIGFTIFIIMLYHLGYMPFKASVFLKNGYESGIALGVFWAVTGIAVGEMLDCLLRGPSVAMDIFYLCGIAAGYVGFNDGKMINANKKAVNHA
jgi:O-antigen ligase